MPRLMLVAGAALGVAMSGGLLMAQPRDGHPRAAASPAYKQASLPVEARVADLIARMTPDEKIAQLRGGMQTMQKTDDELDALQRRAVGATRLGIPILFYDDGAAAASRLPAQRNAAPDAGKRNAQSEASALYPGAIAIAASWDTALAEEAGALHALALRARGGRMAFLPVLELSRDPRFGVVEQSFGEDPYLAGELGVATVKGWQGTASPLAPGKALIAVGRFAGYGDPRSGAAYGPPRSGAGALPTARRELREVFFRPYEMVVKRAAPAAIVVSRNDLDGVPSHADRWLLRDVLRREWGFGGAVLSDAGGIRELQSVHGIAGDAARAARLAFDAGIDIDLPDGSAYQTLRTPRAAQKGPAGATPNAPGAGTELDAALSRMLALKFRAGLFEQPFADRDAQNSVRDQLKTQAAALHAAQRAIVLLKNAAALPLLRDGAKATPRVVVLETALRSDSTASLAEGLRARARGRVEAIVVPDSRASAAQGNDAAAQAIQRIVDATRAALPDYVVLALGDDWSATDADLLRALRALGKPVIAILDGRQPHADPRVAATADALVGAWSLGAQGGNALADALLGDIGPGGKLPVTLARSAGQLPITYDAKPSARRGYLFESGEPLFAFGWGLAYTTFELGPPRLSRTSMSLPNSSGTGNMAGSTRNDTIDVSVDIRNTGNRAGDETVQLYVRDKVSSVTRPVKELRGFQRVTLAPGERRTLVFTLDAGSLEMWDEALRRVVEPGEFDIMTGPNSTELQSVTLTVTGRTLP